jgi:hypothetical protein
VPWKIGLHIERRGEMRLRACSALACGLALFLVSAARADLSTDLLQPPDQQFTSIPPSPSDQVNPLVAEPEPASLSLVMFGATLIGVRRRR